MTSRFKHPALALLLAAAVGACGSSYDENADNDSGTAGAGSAHGTSIGQTPGYGAPGAGGAMGDTARAGGALPPSGGVSSPNAAAATAGRRDTVGGTNTTTGAARDTTRRP